MAFKAVEIHRRPQMQHQGVGIAVFCVEEAGAEVGVEQGGATFLAFSIYGGCCVSSWGNLIVFAFVFLRQGFSV